MQTIKVKIQGLDCAECSVPFEKFLSKLQGVQNIGVSYATQEARITIDDSKTSEAKITNIIKDKGYTILQETKQKKDISQLIIFAFITVIAILLLLEIVIERLGLLELPFKAIPTWILVIATLVGGFNIFKSAFQGLRVKQINSDLLMTIGIVASMLIREFSASTLIVFFMNIAHFLEGFTVRSSRKAIQDIIELAPEKATILRNGKEIEVATADITIGDIVIAKPGEKISVDGKVTFGTSSVDQAPITGESVPVEKSVYDEVFAGTINQHGVLHIKTEKVGENTTLSKVIKLVEEAESAKAPFQKFADRYSTYYLPVILISGLLTFFITHNPVYAIAVLVIACPCAIALATPIAVVAATGSAAKRGIIIKGGLYLEALAKVDTVVVDKTGTLTYGKPQVTDIIPFNIYEKELIKYAASLERSSEHPLASAVVEEAEKMDISLLQLKSFKYHVGEGILGKIENNSIIVGNDRLLERQRISIPTHIKEQKTCLEEAGKSVMYVVKGKSIIGLVATADTLREGIKTALQELKRVGIQHIILLTGDTEQITKVITKSLGIKEYLAGILPQEKITYIQKLQSQGKKVLMVGDGVNDAPALAQADVGIAMGSGTDVAIETSHVVLMQDDWLQIPEAIRLGKKTFSTIKQNIAFGVIFNIGGIVLASVGILTPILAAAAQSLPDVAVFINSSKLLRR